MVGWNIHHIILKRDKLPNYEINEIKLFSTIPNDLTYPFIQPFLYNKVIEFLKKV